MQDYVCTDQYAKKLIVSLSSIALQAFNDNDYCFCCCFLETVNSWLVLHFQEGTKLSCMFAQKPGRQNTLSLFILKVTNLKSCTPSQIPSQKCATIQILLTLLYYLGQRYV